MYIKQKESIRLSLHITFPYCDTKMRYHLFSIDIETHQYFKIDEKDIEDIYFFEVNTKYISSSELKTSKFSRVRSTSENLDVFKSRDEIYLVFTDKK